MEEHQKDWGALVTAAQSGDERAFETLIKEIEPVLYPVIHSFFKNKEDIEDALQETYLIIYRSFAGLGRASIKDPEKFQAWSKQVARNVCRNTLDRQKRKQSLDDLRPETTDEEFAGLDLLANDEFQIIYHPEQFAEEKELQERVQEKVNQLNGKRKDIFLLYLQQYSYDEISEMLVVPKGTVKSNIHYTKKIFTRDLRQEERAQNVKVNGFYIGPVGQNLVIRIFTKTPYHIIKIGEGNWVQADQISKSDATSKKHSRLKWSLGKKIGISALSLVGAALITFGSIQIAQQPRANLEQRSHPQNTVLTSGGNSQNIVIRDIGETSKIPTKDLNQLAISSAENTKAWRDAALMDHAKIVDTYWKKNCYIVVLKIILNKEEIESYDIIGDYLKHYFTYCVIPVCEYSEDTNTISYERIISPTHRINMFSSTGTDHMAFGFHTQEGAKVAAEKVAQ